MIYSLAYSYSMSVAHNIVKMFKCGKFTKHHNSTKFRITFNTHAEVITLKQLELKHMHKRGVLDKGELWWRYHTV